MTYVILTENGNVLPDVQIQLHGHRDISALIYLQANRL